MEKGSLVCRIAMRRQGLFGQEALCDRTEAGPQHGVQLNYARLISGFLMRNFVLLGFLLLVMVVPVQAQDADYRLREPDVVEYVTAIVENAAWSGLLQRRIILEEINERFSETLVTLSYDLLRSAVDLLYDDAAFQEYGYLPHQEQWERAMLLAWLRENAVDLSENAVLDFDDYDIQVSIVDFNGDGIDEFILDVVRGCRFPPCRPAALLWGSADYQELLILQQERQGNVHLIQTPLPWLSNHYHYTFPESGVLVPEQITDINGDGLPEWIVMSVFPAGRDITGVQLYVLGWSEGQLIDLTGEPLSYRTLIGTRDYDQLDVWTLKEGIPTIEQRIPIPDNWRCVREEITEYVWNGKLFESGDRQVVFPDTFECLVRNAEGAAYIHDFESAIPLYEQALALEEQANYADYIKVRLAIAYALINEIDQASELLESIEGSTDASLLASAILDVRPMTKENLCLAAYNFLVINPLYVSNSFGISPGHIDDSLYSPIFSLPDPPETSACDVDWLLDQSLANRSFNLTDPPTEQVREMGWPVSQSFSADLNMDGIDEWLVWLESEMLHPILFISDLDAESYIVTRFNEPPLCPYQPDETYTYGAVELPDESKALVTLDYRLHHPYDLWTREMGGHADCYLQQYAGFRGPLTMWRLGDDGLEPFFFTYIDRAGDIDDFVHDGTVRGWRLDYPFGLTEQIYTWDSTTRTFTAPAVPTPTPTSEPAPDTMTVLLDSIRSYTNDDFSQVLIATDDLLQRTEEIVPDELLAARYLRALALEALDRPDEALAEYVAIYEAAPESAWGMLAALHFEVVDG